MDNMKISFDFDSTLAENRIKKVAKKFIDSGNDVWVTTSRLYPDNGDPTWNKDLFATIKGLGIPAEKIQFTDGNDKWRYLEGFDIHFDDDQIEIELIEENLPECATVLVLDN